MLKNILIIAAKLAVTSGFMYFVLRDVQLESLSARLGTLSPFPLIGAAALVFFQNIAVVTWRWERVVAAIDRAVLPWRLMKIVVISLFFNQVLPSTVGGDGMRVWLLRGQGRSIGLAFRSVLIDRLMGFFGALLLALTGALYLMAVLEDSGPGWFLALVSLAGLVLIAAAPLLIRGLGWLPVQAVRRSLENIAREVDLLARDKARLTILVGSSILGQIALSGSVFLLAQGLGLSLDPIGVLAVVPGIMIVSAIPISIAGWGVREGTMVVGLGLLGVARGDAALVSIAFGLLSLLLGLLGGVLWLIHRGRQPARAELDDMSATSEDGRT